jgi:hypothetical protein
MWYLIRRVPKEFEQLDRRVLVRMSTNIAVADDPRATRAKDVVRQLNTELEAYWRGMRDGQSAEARLRFEAAQKRAKALGVPYRTAEELSAGRIEDVLTRVESLIERNALESETDVSAVLGGEGRPKLIFSGLVEEYEALHSSSLAAMSEPQRRRWRNPKLKAVKNFIEVVGDRQLDPTTRDDAITFRQWWQKRIVTDDLDIGTANKDFGHLNKMWTAVDMAHHMNLKPVFARMRIEGEEQGQRAAFTPAHVQNAILVPGALDGLNGEAQDLIYLIADTGLRPSEAAGLLPEQIHLDAPIPFVEIRPIGRKLKNPQSARDMPLVGCALAAMRRRPNGFPRYRDKADSLSAIANKMLGKRKLLPTDNHSLYSLRHTFEDRLTAVEAPEKLIAALMGHKYFRPKYGAGPSLEQKREWLERIAFKPPVEDLAAEWVKASSDAELAARTVPQIVPR